MYTLFSKDFFDLLIALSLAGVLGGAIGFERERNKVPAGFRTHVLVTIGAALVMTISKYILATGSYTNFDPTRLGAQVISGIGFLGAGTIIRYKASVKGLTSAAGLWACACVGLACGSGFYLGAVIATLIILITLISLKRVEKRFMRKEHDYSIEIMSPNKLGIIKKVLPLYKELGVDVISIKFLEESIKFKLSSTDNINKSTLIAALDDLKLNSDIY